MHGLKLLFTSLLVLSLVTAIHSSAAADTINTVLPNDTHTQINDFDTIKKENKTTSQDKVKPKWLNAPIKIGLTPKTSLEVLGRTSNGESPYLVLENLVDRGEISEQDIIKEDVYSIVKDYFSFFYPNSVTNKRNYAGYISIS